MQPYKIKFDKQAEKDLEFWAKNSPKDYCKILDLLDEMSLHPRTGTGNPKQLREKGKHWSRHINKKDIIKYEIHDREIYVYVISARGHYDDH